MPRVDVKIVPFDQADQKDTLSGRGPWARRAVLLAPGLLGASASDHGHGRTPGAASTARSRTRAPGANPEHAHIPLSQEQADPSRAAGLEQETWANSWSCVLFSRSAWPLPSATDCTCPSLPHGANFQGAFTVDGYGSFVTNRLLRPMMFILLRDNLTHTLLRLTIGTYKVWGHEWICIFMFTFPASYFSLVYIKKENWGKAFPLSILLGPSIFSVFRHLAAKRHISWQNSLCTWQTRYI